VNTVAVGTFPIAIAITPNGASAYVATDGDNTVWVINTASNTVTAAVVAGNAPRGVAVSPDGAYAYVSNRISDDVTVINTATNAVAATISAVAFLPEGIAIKP
jgi:YVTN family beta-propeller protein